MAEKYRHSDGTDCLFPEKLRCRARSTRTHNRCKQRVVEGLRVCRNHGGNLPQCRSKSARVIAMRTLAELVRPIPGSDPEANPIAAFELEFRRTIARIRYFDSVLADLDPNSLGWGVSKETEVTSSEFPGTDTERTAQVNIYYRMQVDERKHLVDLVKVWIGAKLDVRKLEVEEQKVEALNNVIEIVLTKLGHDIKDPAVRTLVHDTMLRLPVAGTDSAKVIASAQKIIASPTSLVSEAERAGRQRQHGHRGQHGRVGRG